MNQVDHGNLIEPEQDWSTEPAEASGVTVPAATPVGISGLDLFRETTRGQLARRLMALLIFTVGAIMLIAALQLAGIIDEGQVSVRELGQIVLTPVVTLTGTALGFYFGIHSATAQGGPSTGNLPEREPGKLRQAIRWIW